MEGAREGAHSSEALGLAGDLPTALGIGEVLGVPSLRDACQSAASTSACLGRRARHGATRCVGVAGEQPARAVRGRRRAALPRACYDNVRVSWRQPVWKARRRWSGRHLGELGHVAGGRLP